MLAYGSTRYSYDKNGSLLYKTEGPDTTRYTYDNLGNLLSVILPNATIIEYITDAQNRRIGRKVNGIVTNRWLYSGELTPVAELDSAGNVITRYVYGTKSNIPDYYIKNNTVYRIISDHLGSLRMVVNTATGEVVKRVDYDEYGRIINNIGTAELPFGFAGGMYDSLTGLVRFGARDYSAREGRWTAKDPIQFNGGDYNLYGYCLHDPVNWIDGKGTTISAAMQLALINFGVTVVTDLIADLIQKESWSITDVFKATVHGIVNGALTWGIKTYGIDFGTVTRTINCDINPLPYIFSAAYGMITGVAATIVANIFDRGGTNGQVMMFAGALAGIATTAILANDSNSTDKVAILVAFIVDLQYELTKRAFRYTGSNH